MKLYRALLLCVFATSMHVQPAYAEFKFQAAEPTLRLEFPRDHGAHTQFETEWWYFTGQLVREGKNLFDDKADFGFELTFFRRSEPVGISPQPSQGYLAHAALSDISAQAFLFGHQICGDMLGICGATPNMLQTWNRSWRAEAFGDQVVLQYDLIKSATSPADVSLRLVLPKPGAPLLHGEQGFSRKGECPTCASHYYSLPGVEARGHLKRGDELIPVHGLVWMDHEFMSNSLQTDQSGWDWFALMFRDGRRLMLYRLRKKGGGDSWVSGTLSHGQSVKKLSSNEFSIAALDTWKNSRGVTYPAHWRVQVPGEGIDETISPLIPDQEIRGQGEEGHSYWEGAVQSSSKNVIGYVELTGYEKELAGAL